MVFQFFSIIFAKRERDASSSFRVVLGDLGCDVTCQACRENLLRTHTRFQASSGNSDSMDWPGYEAGDASQNGGSQGSWVPQDPLSQLPPYPLTSPPPPLLVRIVYFTKCRFMQIILFPGRICVITLAPSHPLLKCEQITDVNYQVSAKVNRLENKVSGKGKKGAQHLQPESIICEVTCSTGAKYTLYR